MSFSKIPSENTMAYSTMTAQLPMQQNYPSNSTYASINDSGRSIVRPPMPPPRYQSSYMYSNPNPNNYNSYSGYSSFNRPLYNGYNSYSPYQSNYYNSYSNPTMPFDARNNFTEEAQERSREAFANIERIVHTFGSVNMMIESTYYALQSSFNAVLSVAENLSRLKSQFGQILSAFTLIRSCQWLYRKLLYLIGLRSMDPTTESAWKNASQSNFEDPFESSPKRSAWPMLIFIASIYIGPLLMWKFISFLRQSNKATDEKTVDGDTNYFAIAKYDYKARSPEELSFSAGEYLKLAPYEKQTDKLWPLASNGKRNGIVPVNYIDIKLNTVHKNRQTSSSSTGSIHRPTEVTSSKLQKPITETTVKVGNPSTHDRLKDLELVKEEHVEIIVENRQEHNVEEQEAQPVMNKQQVQNLYEEQKAETSPSITGCEDQNLADDK